MRTQHKIDWIAATLPSRMPTLLSMTRYVRLAVSSLDNHWVADTARNGYTIAARNSDGAQSRTSNREDMGTHLILPGSALNAMTERQTLHEIITALVANSARFSRIDVALDVFDSDLSIAKLHRLSLRGKCKTKAKAMPVYVQSGDDAQGQTMYLGARTSERFLRIYNKAAERKAKGEASLSENWIRIELEIKGDRADNAAHAIASEIGLDETIRAHILDYIDFPSYDAWGACFAGNSVQVQESARKLTDTEKWLLEQVAPSFARILQADPTFADRFMVAVQNALENG